jgi:hypothetical protein|nr:MAG TPA: Protein of unknown function (DUF2829) [Caudoviricetes sp.]
MSYLEELLPAFRNGVKIRRRIWDDKELFVKINEAGEPVLNNGNKFEFCRNINCSDWELYQENIDWDYIVKSKCLCWFWDGDGSQTINKLQCIGEGEFYDDCSRTWEYCRPVRRDEVAFYEDEEVQDD